jgi:hypothetical protein
MATRFQVTFDAAEPGRLAGFWALALGYRREGPPERWDDHGWLVDPDGVGARLFFQRVPEQKTAKNRVHLDLHVSGPPGTPPRERRRGNAAAASTPRRRGWSRPGRPGSPPTTSRTSTGWSCRTRRATSSAWTEARLPTAA